MIRNQHSIDMCNGSIFPKMMQMAWPMVLSSLLSMSFSAADMIVVGNFGSEHAMAAVGSTGSIVSLLVNLFYGLSIGTGVLCARYIGAQDEKNVSETVHTSVVLSLISGVLLMVVGLCFSEQFLIWMNTPPEVLGPATVYLRIYFVTLIPAKVGAFTSTILNAQGDTKRPAYFGIIAGVVNVVLNLVFVIVLKLDVAGVAIATFISSTLSAGLTVRCLLRTEGCCRLYIRKLHLNKRITWELLRIGIPASLQNMAFALSNVVIQSSINSFGPIVMAGNAAAVKVEEFINIGLGTFTSSGSTFVSQNFGAKKYTRVDRSLRIACCCTVVCSVLICSLVLAFAKPLIGLFDPRPEILEPSLTRLWTICGFYALCGLMSCLSGAIRGLGHSALPSIVTVAGVCGFRLLWIFTVFQVPQYHTLQMLYLSYGSSWIITLAAHAISYVCVRRKLPRSDVGEE